MTQLKLFVLGSPRVECKGQIIDVKPRKAMALFIYLACTGQAHERDTLATLFWPDSSQKQARSALRGRLFELRATLGAERFSAEGQSLSLSFDEPIWIDAHAVEEALTRYQRHQHPRNVLCPTCRAALTAAVAHYQDDFLRGFTLARCLEFDEWQFFQAESLRQDLAVMLEALINWHHDQAEFDAAIGYARQQLSLDNLHEPAHRRLMTLYAQAGQPAAALRQFDICDHLFQDELGVEPEEETVALATAIREKRLAPEPPSLPQALPQQAAPIVQERPVFVARESTLAQLEAALNLTLGGQGQLRLITGEAGAGKSALVTEFLYQARQKRSDLIVSLAAADAQTGQLDTFLLFREILRNLIDSAETNPNRAMRGSIGSALLDHGPDLIANFVPEVDQPDLLAAAQAAGWAGQPAAAKQAISSTSPVVDQGEIIEQVVALLTAVAAHNPLVVVLEDLHWADTVSLALIHRLGRQLTDSRLLILGTYRPEQAHLPGEDEDQPLEKMGRELQRNLGEIFIDLEALRAREGRTLVDDLLDIEPNLLNDSFREALYHQTGGHPLFVVELLQDFRETEDLVRDEAGRWVIGATFDWQALPARVEGTIASRMAHLSEEQRWLLSIASVMGEYFLAEVVAQVSDTNPRKLTHILSRALQTQHHLVEAQGVERLGQQRLTRYRFRHNLMQVYLYENLDAVERVYLHEDVADILESLYREEIERVALPLARHYQVAGITKKAVNYLQTAGEEAVRLGDSLQGTRHFSRALTLLMDLPEATERQQQALQLQLSLGQAYDTITHTGPESFEAYNQALSLARQLNDTRNTIHILCTLTGQARSSARLDMAQRYSQESLRLAEESQDPELLMLANDSLFSLALGLGQYSEAVAYVEALVSYYRRLQTELSLDDAYNLAIKLGYAGLVLAPAGFLDRALACGQEGLALMQQHSHYWGQAAVLGLLATVYERRGEWPEVVKLGQAMIEASQAHDFHLMRTFGEMHKGIGLAMLGRPDEGTELVRQAIAEREAMNMHGANTEYLAYAGLGYGLTGQAEQGLALVNEAIHKMKMNQEQEAEAVIRQIKGDLLLMQDLSEAESARVQGEAEAFFRQAIEIAREGGTKLWEIRALTSLCRLLYSQGKDEGCRQQLAELYGWFTEGFETEDLQVARAVLEELRK